jgi:hypothetical protein
VGSKEITVVLTKSSDSPSEVNLTVDFSLQDVSAAFRRTITVAAGSTVYDVFIKAMNATGVDYTIRSGSYIEIIDGLAEGDRGANSGWMFIVNGNHPVVGIAGYHVKSGDEIVFHYSSDYTRERTDRIGRPVMTVPKTWRPLPTMSRFRWSSAMLKKTPGIIPRSIS